MLRMTKRYLELEARGLKARERAAAAPQWPAHPDLEQLFDALIKEFAAAGIGDRSLRELAEAIGTSHRMLLHRFGSRNELLPAIVQEVERRQMAVLPDTSTEPADGIAAMWADPRPPELRPFERLFSECYARGAQAEEPFARMVPGAVDAWLAEVDATSGETIDPALVRPD